MAALAERDSETRPKPADSEKITINLGFVDLGHIDLMVRDGFYANRTDFIRTAIRNQLERHGDAVRQSVARKRLSLGLTHYGRRDLEAAVAAGETLANTCVAAKLARQRSATAASMRRPRASSRKRNGNSR